VNLNPVEMVVMTEGDPIGLTAQRVTRAVIESALRYWTERPKHPLDPHVERLVCRELGGTLYLLAVLTPLGMQRKISSEGLFWTLRFDVPRLAE
jgi:hypothetical protein